MSFLFKSSKKNAGAAEKNALPPATREIRSSDGPASQIPTPTLNGALNGGASKPGSPTPGLASGQQSGSGHGSSKNGSLNSLVGVNGSGSGSAGNERSGNGGGSVSAAAREIEEKMAGGGGGMYGAGGMRGQDGAPGGPVRGSGPAGTGPPSPEQKSLRERGQQQEGQMNQRALTTQQQPSQQSSQQPARPPPTDSSPYPWSQRRLAFTVSHTNPFPRYGAAVNATGSKDGCVYLMGGLINGSTVKGDLWMVEAGTPANTAMTCYPVATTSEGPGPRVGHASLLVGNAFIVFGGDTKMDEGDALDDTLYLLNTSTKQWSRALPAGPRPPGRYGHTLNILGSKIYIFGGQVEGFFFNDLVAFDLNALQQSTNKWEILIQNTIDGGPPAGQIPPARTNHTVVSYGEKLYLFGGTDGVRWFNDVWSYSPHTNSWTELSCIGYIPSPREGHAAALVGDVMYIFGGRTEEGNDLGDLAAFRIGSRRWYTFQNMGPSPSPRSGHSMTTVGKMVVVLAGEPSSAPRDVVELGLAYFLDTGKIRYPPAESASPGKQVQEGISQQASPSANAERGLSSTRRPSQERSTNNNTNGINGVPMNASGREPPRLGGVQQQQQQQQQQPQQQPVELMDRRMNSGDSAVPAPLTTTSSSTPGNPGSLRSRAESNSRLPRASPAPSGPPPQAPQQGQQSAPRTNGVMASRQPTRPGMDRAFSPVNGGEAGNPRVMSPSRSAQGSPAPGGGSGVEARIPTSPGMAASPTFGGSPTFGASPTFGGAGMFDGVVGEQQPESREQKVNGGQQRFKPETYRPSQDQSAGDGVSQISSQRPTLNSRTRAPSHDVMEQETPRQSVEPEHFPQVRALQQEETEEAQQAPQDSGIGSSPAAPVESQRFDDLSKELEQAKQRNAWFASELALARKSGYSPSSSSSPVHNRSVSSSTTLADSPLVDERAVDVFADDDKPLIEALLRMRRELARVQETIDGQSRSAAERIAAMERQRDVAVREAVFAKQKLAGQGLSSSRSPSSASTSEEGGGNVAGKLAASSAAREELEGRVGRLEGVVEGERRGREMAESLAEAAQKRVQELDAWRREQTVEMEGLREELREAQGKHRDISASHSDISAQHQMLSVEHRELSKQLGVAQEAALGHEAVLGPLREGLTASSERAETLERQLEAERQGRGGLETQLRQLKVEHEERTGELESTSRRLRDAEEMAGKHAAEAKTHREAVLAGLGKVTDRGLDPTPAADERVAILQQQVEAANALCRQNQSAADAASEKLRRAEERIAGLEAYQEQASREGLGMRKQLQVALREHAAVASEKAELEGKLQSQMLETNALAVQHNSLKDVLAERGVNPSDVRRSRAMDSPSSLGQRFSTPDPQRVREVEQQLEASLRSHDEMKAQFEAVEQREGAVRREYEEKLTALDNDHQAAVKYLRGTEKMLSKMKQELQRVKGENGELRKRVEEVGSARGTPVPNEEWEQERSTMKRELEQTQNQLKETVSGLEGRIEALQRELHSTSSDLEQTREAHASHQQSLQNLQTTHERTQGDVETLRRENGVLEERARDAEMKVQLLLDQVESSVDNYRRQSTSAAAAANTNGIGGSHHQRGLSATSNGSTTLHGDAGGFHSRNISDAGDSTYSADMPGSVTSEDAPGRNSMALDSLASELDALRSHWETTNKNYRLSDHGGNHLGPFQFPAVGSGGAGYQHAASGSQASDTLGGSLASWRKGLDMGDEDESRPTTSDGTVRGEGDEEGEQQQHHGMAVTTPGGMI